MFMFRLGADPKVTLFTLSRVGFKNMRVKPGEEGTKVKVGYFAGRFLNVRNNQPIDVVLQAAKRFQALNDLPRMRYREDVIEELMYIHQRPLSPLEIDHAVAEYSKTSGMNFESEVAHGHENTREYNKAIRGGFIGALMGAGLGCYLCGSKILSGIFFGAGIIWTGIEFNLHLSRLSKSNSTMSFLSHLEQVPGGSGNN
jgi:hypothetical protein